MSNGKEEFEKYFANISVPKPILIKEMLSIANELCNVEAFTIAGPSLEIEHGLKRPTGRAIIELDKLELVEYYFDTARYSVCVHPKSKLDEWWSENYEGGSTEKESHDETDQHKGFEIPAEYREGGEPGGKPLTAKYLALSTEWPIFPIDVNTTRTRLNRLYGKETVNRIDTKRPYTYNFKDLSALQRKDSMKEGL